MCYKEVNYVGSVCQIQIMFQLTNNLQHDALPMPAFARADTKGRIVVCQLAVTTITYPFIHKLTICS